MIKIIAGIVLYNPNINKLLDNINSIKDQVRELILVDNGSDNIDEICRAISKDIVINIIKNNKNEGIARALNQIFQYAKERKYEWVLALDQDSKCPADIIEKYSIYLSKNNIAVLSPIITDRNYKYDTNCSAASTVEDIEYCITSASLNLIKAWEETGGFLESLFIDFVDFEYCIRVRKKGYRIVRINTIEIEHEIGKGENHNFFGKNIIVLNHSPARKYYACRNWLYFIINSKGYINSLHEWRSYFFFFLKTALYEQDKKEKILAMVKGMIDGIMFCKQMRK